MKMIKISQKLLNKKKIIKVNLMTNFPILIQEVPENIKKEKPIPKMKNDLIKIILIIKIKIIMIKPKIMIVNMKIIMKTKMKMKMIIQKMKIINKMKTKAKIKKIKIVMMMKKNKIMIKNN
jgi:hypothetical protein